MKKISINTAYNYSHSFSLTNWRLCRLRGIPAANDNWDANLDDDKLFEDGLYEEYPTCTLPF